MLKNAPKNVVQNLSKEEIMSLQKEYVLGFQSKQKEIVLRREQRGRITPLTGYPSRVIDHLVPLVRKKIRNQVCSISISACAEQGSQEYECLYKTTSLRHANSVKKSLQFHFGRLIDADKKIKKGTKCYYILLHFKA